MMKQNEKKILITLKINKETLNLWDKYCSENNIRRSALIRDSVNKFIKDKPIEVLLDELIFKYTRAVGKTLEKRIAAEFNQIKSFLSETEKKANI